MFWCWVVSLVVVRSTMASLLLRGFLTMVPGSAVRMTATIITMSAAMDQKKLLNLLNNLRQSWTTIFKDSHFFSRTSDSV